MPTTTAPALRSRATTGWSFDSGPRGAPGGLPWVAGARPGPGGHGIAPPPRGRGDAPHARPGFARPRHARVVFRLGPAGAGGQPVVAAPAAPRHAVLHRDGHTRQ